MNDWGWLLFAGSLLAGFIALTVWRSYQPESEENDPSRNVIIHPLARNEFSHLFAGALLSENGRKVLVPLLAASGKVFTPREALMVKYALGEIGKDAFLREVDDMTTFAPSYHDPVILLEQINILKNAFGESSRTT